MAPARRCSTQIAAGWAVWFALLQTPAFGLPEGQPLAERYHSSWTAREGLSGVVVALAQTTDGFLWVGTTDGLFRFDGVSFELYKPQVGSFPSTAVFSLMAVPDGGLWIGYIRGGASLLKDGRVTNYSEREGFPVAGVRSFARDQEGTIWAAVVGGFARLEGERWHQVRMDWNYPDKSAQALFVDRKGTLWAAGSGRILYLLKGTRRFEDLGIRIDRMKSFAQAPDGSIWFGDYASQLTVRSFWPPGETPSRPLAQIDTPGSKILFEGDGAMWITGDGVTRVPNQGGLSGWIPKSSKELERFTEKDGLTDDEGEVAFEDREGNIWVGTDGGLDRFRHRNLSWYPSAEDIRAFSLVAGDHGEVWAGNVTGIFRVQDGKQAIGAPRQIRAVYRDPDGSLWVSARGSFWHWKSGSFIPIRPPDPVQAMLLAAPNDPLIVTAMAKDPSGGLWTSIGGGGVFVLQNDVWRFVTVLPDHPDWSPISVHCDDAGRIWLAYGNAIGMVDRGQVQTFSSSSGLTFGPVKIMAGRVQVWAGGEGGLGLYQGGRFRELTGADGARFGPVTGIVETSHDGLWLSSVLGIVHIPEREMRRVLQDGGSRVDYESMDQVSDLPETLQRGSVSGSEVIQASDGILWFATRKGFARVDPASLYRNPIPPPVVIRSVIADGRSYPTFAKPALPALTKELRIDYTALSLSIPERVRFRYRLDGSGQDWQEAGTRRQAFYRDLSPRRYRFRVVACNNDGVWNDAGAALEFSVAPAWYQTTAFLLFCIASGLCAVWGAYRLRVRQIAAAMSARFDERLAERTRLARDLHDTLLQTIQASKMVADDLTEQPVDPLQWRRTAVRLSGWLGQAVQEGRAALNSLRDSTTQRNDLAEGLRQAAEESCGSNSMNFVLTVIGSVREMHPIVRDEVYRIGYEAIRNSCMHSGGSRLEVEIGYAQDLTLRVADNGNGIEPDIAASGKTGHFGLQGMRERAARIGGRLSVGSPGGTGTEIRLMVPGSIIFRGMGPDRQNLPARIKALFKTDRNPRLD